MSQAKVDRYKAEKKNRAQMIKKQKRQAFAAKVCAAAVGVLMVGWIGYSAYDTLKPEPVKASYEINTTALDDFINGIDAE